MVDDRAGDKLRKKSDEQAIIQKKQRHKTKRPIRATEKRLALKKKQGQLNEKIISDIAASFQSKIVEILIKKMNFALQTLTDKKFNELDMGTSFDSFKSLSFHGNVLIPKKAQKIF